MVQSKNMKQKKFSLNRKDDEMRELVNTTNKKTLAIWAVDCAERILPYFEQKYPEDRRPRNAILTLKEWILTGKFRMAVIRKASLDAHAAAREVGENNPSRSAARSAGQAVATAHVARHAYGSAIYAQQAIYRAHPVTAHESATGERNWQYKHLMELKNKLG